MSKITTNLVAITSLAALADNKVSELAQNYGALPADLAASLEEAKTKRAKELNDKAANHIIDLLEQKDAAITSVASTVVELERQIADQKAYAAKIQQAASYGLHEKNFMPLLKILGATLPSGLDKELTKVPADWAAPVAAA